MKRQGASRKVKTKSKESNESVLAAANNNFFSASSDSEQEVVKRKRVIQQRKSVIENDKEKRNAESNEGTPTRRGRGEKRKSKGNISGRDSGSDFSSDPDTGKESDYENRSSRGKRFRRRLSKRVDNDRTSMGSALNISYGNLNMSTASPTVGSPSNTPTDRKTLQEIYSTCSALFQAHRITPQNAFSLKLVECLDEIIKSDDFDKNNLPLMARTLEIGGKIYVCRVDGAHSHTIKLATEIAANQNEVEGNDPGVQMDDNDDQEGAENGEGRKKARRVKKRSRFIEDNDAKLNTKFENQSSKYATRRTTLKASLHRNIDEELDFDYLAYFMSPGEVHPIETPEQFEALKNKAYIPDSHVNEEEFKTIPWLPFHTLKEWDSSKFDLWGVPLASAGPLDVSALQQQPPIMDNNDEFAYNPDNRPDEYPEPEPDVQGNGFGCDDLMGDHFDDAPHETIGGLASQPLQVDQLKSLDDLKQFFASLKGIQLNLKNKYGWAGPIFLKPHRPDFRKRAADGKTPKKPDRRKKIMLMDYDEVDWKDKHNRYIDGGWSKTTLDDKTLAKWAAAKTVTPYCNSQNFLGYDDDEEDYRDPFDNIESSEDYMANIIRFFVDSNRNIFKLMEEEFKEGKDVLSQSFVAQEIREDDGFQDLDLEAPRDYSDDSFGNGPVQAEPEGDVENFGKDDFPGMNLTAMFPGSLATESNDPFSKVSEFDSVKFSKQPKPIDMHAMKVVIRQILTEKLLVDEEGKPTIDAETKCDVVTLITEMMKRVDARMAKHMSVAIVIVGLMHVVADNKFFMVSNENSVGFDNPWIVCRGRLWRHKDNIPMARDFVE